MPKKPPLGALTGIRFLAAFIVVLFHTAQPFLSNWPDWALSIINRGYVGVSLFFVLSGFILAYNYLEPDNTSTIDKRSFWSARLARVYPVYLLGLVVAMPFFVTRAFRSLPFTSALSHIGGVSLATGSLTQAWVPAAACELNCPGWSLSAEAFFYLLFPFLVVAISGLCSRKLLALGSAIWIASMAVPALYYLIGPDALPNPEPTKSAFWLDVVKFNPLIRLPEFLIGILLGKIFLRQALKGSTSVDRSGWWAGGVGLTIVVVLVSNTRSLDLLLHNSLLTPLFALLIYFLAWGGGIWGSVLSFRPVQLLGEASYALYILHVPLWHWFGKAMEITGLVPESSPVFLVSYLVLSVAVSTATLKVLEEPARDWLRRKLSRPRTIRPSTIEKQPVIPAP